MAQREKIILETISTSKKVAFLKDPETYPEKPDHIEVIETHMSLLFLTPSLVYKLKKPVKFDAIDFSTLQARQVNCREEFRLNKELAEQVYLDVLPLNRDKSGKLDLGGRGKPVDWLVKMKRLDNKKLLNHALLLKQVDNTLLLKVSKKLAEFYKTREAIFFEPEDYLLRLEKKTRGIFKELQEPQFGLSQDLLTKIFNKQILFLRKHKALFSKRIRKGKIVEAHGDLKPEHICLDEEPVIIDRLEFDKDLRIQDIVEELAFLATECELLGGSQTGEFFFSIYEKYCGDKVPQALKNFYKSRQAFHRAKFAIWHLREDRYRGELRWRIRTDRCLKLAKLYADLLD
jgi:aminoglycoside phosphotransferase family enzyme